MPGFWSNQGNDLGAYLARCWLHETGRFPTCEAAMRPAKQTVIGREGKVLQFLSAIYRWEFTPTRMRVTTKAIHWPPSLLSRTLEIREVVFRFPGHARSPRKA